MCFCQTSQRKTFQSPERSHTCYRTEFGPFFLWLPPPTPHLFSGVWQTVYLFASILSHFLCSLLVWQRSRVQYISYIYILCGIIIQKTLPALICSDREFYFSVYVLDQSISKQVSIWGCVWLFNLCRAYGGLWDRAGIRKRLFFSLSEYLKISLCEVFTWQ